jgi:hypothetical protein
MGLVAIVDRVDVLITRRAKTSRIKRPLMVLREQCEAAESQISDLKAAIKASGLPRKVKYLEAQVEVLRQEKEVLQRNLDAANEEILQLKCKQPHAMRGTWPGQKGFT